MNTTRSLFGLLLCCCLLVAPTSLAAKDTSLSTSYAGAGFDLTDPDGDGFAINVFLGKSKGTFGKSDITILSEFALDDDGSVTCPDGFDLPFDLVRAVTTMTTANLDQLYGFFTSGWLCMTADSIRWVGEAGGIYIGGTGRFMGATGDWTTEYSGANFDADAGYRTISGTLRGTVEMP